MRRLTQGLLVTAVITVAGASGFLIHQASSGEASGAEGTQRPNAAASAAPIEVRTVMATVPQAGTVANAESRTAPNPGAGITGTPETAGPAVLEPGATATGTLEARRQAVLAFPVGGVVTALDAADGARVRRGAPLARLDPVPFKAAVDQLTARRDFLRTRLERSEALYRAQAVTREELDADRTDAAAVEAQLATARWNLDHAVLRAPFEGKVTGRRIELGEVVAAGAPAYTLLAVDTLQVEVAVPARDLAGLALDRPIAVRAADQPEITAFGALDHPPVAGDPRSGAVTLVVNVPDPEGRFLPGTLVECAVVARNASPGSTAPAMASPGSSMCSVVVPLSALRVTTRGPVVFRVRDGRVESVPVRTGPVRGDAVRILSGLRPGDTIVNEIPDRLRDGDPVSIAPPAARVSAHGARVSE